MTALDLFKERLEETAQLAAECAALARRLRRLPAGSEAKGLTAASAVRYTVREMRDAVAEALERTEADNV